MRTEYAILFVCTGNTFRSLIAEYSLKSFLRKHAIPGMLVSSAGTIAQPSTPDPRTIAELSALGIRVSHQQRRLTRRLLRESNLVVAMAKDHQEFIRQNFDESVPLFLEIAKGVKESVYDTSDAVDMTDRKAVERHISKTVRLINSSMVDIVKKILLKAEKER